MSNTETQMQKLRERFHVRAASDRVAIVSALEAGDRARILYLAHGLAGAAGIFGYADAGKLAFALEEGVDAGMEDAVVKALGQALIDALDRI